MTGKEFAARRRAMKVSQAEFGSYCDVNQRTISDIETSDQPVRALYRIALCALENEMQWAPVADLEAAILKLSPASRLAVRTLVHHLNELEGTQS